MPQKKYEYRVEAVLDRGHLDDPEYLSMLNDMGSQGFKRVAEQNKGAHILLVLFERETS